jgi:mono/diheme cytochrome c family protein
MNSILDNFVFVVIGGVLLALLASVAGGVVIAVLASFGSRYLRRNLPTDEEMTQLKVEFNRPGRTLVLPRIGPTLEPFVISIVGFLLFFIISSVALGIMARPVPGMDSAAGVPFTGTEAPAASLPKSGDLVEITASLPPGRAAEGEKLFTSSGCVGCHSQLRGERLVGPTFYNLWTTSATRVPGLGAKEYLYQSIVDPNAHVVESFQPNVMQQNFATLLSPQQMADLLAWIEEQHSNEP